jgi:hypothetical protein
MYNYYGFSYRNIEAAEPGSSNGFYQGAGYNLSWTLYNTLTFDHQIGQNQKLKAYVGTEAVLGSGVGLGHGDSPMQIFSMPADRFRCVLCPSDGRAQGCMDLASWSPDENSAPEGRRGAWMPICTLLE